MEAKQHSPQTCPWCDGSATATLRVTRLKDGTARHEHWCASCHADALQTSFTTREIPPLRMDALKQKSKKRRKPRVPIDNGRRRRTPKLDPEHLAPVDAKIRSPRPPVSPDRCGPGARPPGYTEPPAFPGTP